MMTTPSSLNIYLLFPTSLLVTNCFRCRGGCVCFSSHFDSKCKIPAWSVAKSTDRFLSRQAGFTYFFHCLPPLDCQSLTFHFCGLVMEGFSISELIFFGYCKLPRWEGREGVKNMWKILPQLVMQCLFFPVRWLITAQ